MLAIYHQYLQHKFNDHLLGFPRVFPSKIQCCLPVYFCNNIFSSAMYFCLQLVLPHYKNIALHISWRAGSISFLDLYKESFENFMKPSPLPNLMTLLQQNLAPTKNCKFPITKVLVFCNLGRLPTIILVALPLSSGWLFSYSRGYP